MTRLIFSRRRVSSGLAAFVVSASAEAAPKVAAHNRRGIDPAREMRHRALAAVKTWAFQLRWVNFPAIAASPLDMIVIDHGVSDGVRFIRQIEPWEVDYLKTGPDGRRRLVIAYMSIGEAETYRWYWPDAWRDVSQRPKWVGAENPRWPANFPVDFWAPEWQRLIAGVDGYVTRIMAQGYDGIYLDRADVYEELLPRHPQGARTMAAFIARIAASARAANPNTIIILQNAEALISERMVQAAIDAVSKEDLYFGIDHTEAANTPADITAAERDLKRARALGKRVFTVEYVGDPAKQQVVLTRTAAHGFLPYFALRDLRSLTLDRRTLSPDYDGALVPQERAPETNR